MSSKSNQGDLKSSTICLCGLDDRPDPSDKDTSVGGWMNYRKWISVSSLVLFSFILVTKYQNCAQSQSAHLDSEDFIPVDEGSPVSIIDPQSSFKVSFVEDFVEFKDDASEMAFDGLCDSKNREAQLGWVVLNEDGFVMDKGRVPCDLGGFQLELSDLGKLNCGEEYLLEASLGAKAVDSIIIKRRCAPLAKVVDDQLTQELASGSGRCFIEKAQGSCDVVCYEGGKVKINSQLQSCDI